MDLVYAENQNKIVVRRGWISTISCSYVSYRMEARPKRIFRVYTIHFFLNSRFGDYHCQVTAQ